MCSRVFWPNPVAKVAARTLDWESSDEPALWLSPPGIERRGGDDDSALTWTAAHATVAVSGFEVAVTEALNDAGLAVHLLYLAQTEYEPVDDRPEVTNTRVVQWLADTCATVAEAVAALASVRISSQEVRGAHLGGHLALEDSSGDSAIVEFLEGRKVVHHGPDTLVMANDPDYDSQLANLARYRPFGGELPPPGDITSADRFVRASYFLHHLPEPTTYAEAVAGPLTIARNAAVPPGAPYDDFSVYPTWWISAVDVTNRTLYIQTTASPNLVWVSLDADTGAGGATVRTHPVEASTMLAGDITSRFTPADPFF